MPRKWTGRPRGAPLGNRNAFKTGQHTREARAFRKLIRLQIAQAKALVAFVHSTPVITASAVALAKADPGDPISSDRKGA